MSAPRTTPRELRVDWPECRGRGLCHEVLPELIDLDEWGYPIVRGPVTDDLMDEARAAVRSCPRLALRIVAGR
jgi:ferredoxin